MRILREALPALVGCSGPLPSPRMCLGSRSPQQRTWDTCLELSPKRAPLSQVTEFRGRVIPCVIVALGNIELMGIRATEVKGPSATTSLLLSQGCILRGFA